MKIQSQQQKKNVVILILAGLFLLASISLKAAEQTWNINGGAFSDSGTFSGTFLYDADTKSISTWNISIAGGNTTTFPEITLTPQNSSVSIFNFSNSEDTFQFSLTDDSNRQFRMTPENALTNAGGTVELNLNTSRGGSGGVECYNCAPTRMITAGNLSSGNNLVDIPKPEGLSGLWFDPALDGEGYNVINANNGMLVIFYGYNSFGRRLWLLSDVNTQTIRFGETITFGISEFKGGLFSLPLASQSAKTNWGTLSVTFTSCSVATFTLSGTDGEKTSKAVKLTGIVNTDC